jgi:hypothetical protein
MVKPSETAGFAIRPKHKEMFVIDEIPGVLSDSLERSRGEDGDSLTTIFSTGSYDITSDDEFSYGDDDSELTVDASWEEMWSTLQERHSRRDRMLERMSHTKNPAMMELIRKREVLVRQQERDLLLLQHMQEHTSNTSIKRHHERELLILEHLEDLEPQNNDGLSNKGNEGRLDENESHDGDLDENCTVWFDAPDSILEGFASCKTAVRDTEMKDGLVHRIYDIAMFEWYTTVPGVLSLMIHSLAHASLHNVVEVSVEEFKKFCEIKLALLTGRYLNIDTFSECVMLLLGLTLLRLSGFLYWWLNTNDFHCIKIDYHNRLRLNQWDARCLIWVKRHHIIQAMFYFIGYILCFKVVEDVFERNLSVFNQREEILSALPSLQQSERLGICVEPGTLFSTLSCQDELQRLEDERTSAFSEDYFFLWETLYWKSFNAHWANWAATQAGDSVDGNIDLILLAPARAVLIGLSVAVTCIFLLRSYGFAVFSKY